MEIGEHARDRGSSGLSLPDHSSPLISASSLRGHALNVSTLIVSSAYSISCRHRRRCCRHSCSLLRYSSRDPFFYIIPGDSPAAVLSILTTIPPLSPTHIGDGNDVAEIFARFFISKLAIIRNTFCTRVLSFSKTSRVSRDR